MSTYTGKPVVVNVPAQVISDKFADLNTFADRMDKFPEDVRKKIGNLSFTSDSISMTNPQVGQITFTVTERTPELVRMECRSPLPIALTIHLTPVADKPENTSVVTDVDVEIPAMLRPFIAPHMQRAADEFGTMIGSLAATQE